MIEVMLQKLKGFHISFLRQVTGMKGRRLGDETWRHEEAEKVLQAAGTKHIWGYINRRQATVAEWVVLRPIFEVFEKEIRYEGGGRLRNHWYHQTASEQKMKTTIK